MIKSNQASQYSMHANITKQTLHCFVWKRWCVCTSLWRIIFKSVCRSELIFLYIFIIFVVFLYWRLACLFGLSSNHAPQYGGLCQILVVVRWVHVVYATIPSVDLTECPNGKQKNPGSWILHICAQNPKL